MSALAFGMRVTSKLSLQRLVYSDLKAMGLSAQPAIHVARKVSGAYATLRASIRAGNLGEPGSKRRLNAESKPITFRADAAQPYDDRCLSWQLDRRTVSGRAHSAGTPVKRTGLTRPRSVARRAASLSTPT
jgi:putative transposase